MSDIERIMLECRYILSLNKNYQELANILKVQEQTIYTDLNFKLKEYDTILFKRVSKYLKEINNY